MAADEEEVDDLLTVPTPDRAIPARVMDLDPPDDFRAAWQPHKPEFAYACNALSLGMPYGEPYVVASVRRVLDEVDDPELVARAQGYLGEERAHYRCHRRFNQRLTAEHPSLGWVERWLAWSYRVLARRRSRAFNAAFAAGFESIAFASARWIDEHRDELFAGADPVPASLFLWHLAEEVEHKTVAFDVWTEVDGARWRYVAAMTTSFLLLAWFITLGTIVQLVASRRALNPLAWIRLTKWAFGFFFEVAPTMAITALPGHHPSDLADPTWLGLWLREPAPAGDVPAPPGEASAPDAAAA